MNNKQLSKIVDHQRESAGLFGEIAIELGFLSKNDVDKLLILQKKRRNFLGEILVLHGVMSTDDIEEELIQFYEAVEKKKKIYS